MKVIVLGGGSAGWLSAAIIASEYCSDESVEVALVESADIPTIGVGEGTWPTMRSTLKGIGVSETEFLRQCNASFKQGSKFVGWSTGGSDDSYYHPFSPPNEIEGKSAYSFWKENGQNQDFSRATCIQPYACDLSKAPKQIATPEYGGVLNYGYHLDAGKFTDFLKEHCISKLKVEHIVASVTGVNQDDSGFLQSLKLDSGGQVTGDLFIDCSGSRAALIDGIFGVGLVDLSQTSVNNRAVAVHVPYADDSEPIKSATVSTAQDSGWIWDIGLSSRRGVGYVYSNEFTSDEKAVETLSRYVSNEAGQRVSLSPRSICIKPGYRKEFWHKNCVAIGMAAGFIEPLEASALALVELSANFIRDELPRTKSTISLTARRFNEIFTYRWERIEEFLKLHYVLSQRRDTPYWREVTRLDSCPSALREKLELWRYRLPNRYDFLQVEEIFPALSYQYVLYGMGFESELPRAKRFSIGAEMLGQIANKITTERAKVERHLPTNRDLLNRLVSSAFSKI